MTLKNLAEKVRRNFAVSNQRSQVEARARQMPYWQNTPRSNLAYTMTQPFAKAQQWVESPKTFKVAPTLPIPQQAPLPVKAVGMLANMPSDIANAIGGFYLNTASDIGRGIGLLPGVVKGTRQAPTYSSYKSPASRLGMNIAGVNRTLPQVIGNVAGFAEPIIYAYGGGKALNVAKQPLKNLLIHGAKTGLVTGAVGGGSSALSQARDLPLREQLVQGAVGTVTGGTLGMIIGASASVASPTIQRVVLPRLVQAFKATGTKMTEKEAVQLSVRLVNKVWRDLKGRYAKAPVEYYPVKFGGEKPGTLIRKNPIAGKETVGENFYTEQETNILERLGLPFDKSKSIKYRMKKGEVQLGSEKWNKKPKVAKGSLYDIPEKVYHGTNAKFNTFDMAKAGQKGRSFAGKGVYFTNDLEGAKRFGGNVVEAKLDVKKPLVIEPTDINTVYDSLLDRLNAKNIDEIPIKLKQQGYDGIVLKGKEGIDEYVVFDPKKINVAQPPLTDVKAKMSAQDRLYYEQKGIKPEEIVQQESLQKQKSLSEQPVPSQQAETLKKVDSDTLPKVYHAEATPKTIANIEKKAKIDFQKASDKEYREWASAFNKQEGTRTTNKAVNDLAKEIKQSTLLGSVKNSDNWKDKARILYGRETMDRNFEDVMGKEAPAMKAKYLDPVYNATANETRFMNKERTDIKALDIKPGSKESSALQDYGEGNVTVEQLKKEFPKTYSKIIKAETVLRQKYNTYLDMINKSLTRAGYDPIPKRKDYFRHFQDLGTIFDKFGVPTKAEDLPTDINGLTADFKPGRNFFSAQLQRVGGEYKSDAIKGIDTYLEGASKQIYRTDAIQGLRELEKALRTKYEGKQNVTNFVADLTEYTNILAGKKAMVDRAIESMLGRRIYNTTNVLKGQTSANMVGANVSSALTNFIPLTQSLATTGKVNFLRGMMDTMANTFKNDGFIDQSNFLTSRLGSDPLAMTKWQKTQKAGGLLFKYIDNFTSQVVTRSKYLDNISKGMSQEQAIKEADMWARKLMAGRSAGEMPTLFSSRTMGLFTQFQLEVNNQLSFAFKDIPRNFSKVGAASAIAQLFIYSYVFNTFFEKLAGRRPALDPLGVIQQAYQDYTNPDMKKGQATKNLTRNILDQLPFTSITTGGRIPIGAAIPNVLAVATGESTLKKEIVKPLYYLLPPTGGGQIKKVVEGTQAYNQGASTSDSGRVRYPIPQTPINRARTTVFGQYSTPEARKYFRQGENVLGENQSAIFKALNPQEKLSYYQNLIANRDKGTTQTTGIEDLDVLKAKFELSGQNAGMFGNTGFYKTEGGDIKSVGLELKDPTFTKNVAYDRTLVSDYNSKITQIQNYTEALYKDGQLQNDEFLNIFQQLEDQRLKIDKYGNVSKKGTSAKKPKKVAARKVTIPKVKIVQPKKSQMPTIKISKLPVAKKKSTRTKQSFTIKPIERMKLKGLTVGKKLV